jgi:hypothetical protein
MDQFQYLLIRLGARLDYVVPVFLPADIGFLLSKLEYRVTINPDNTEHIVGQKPKTEIYMDGSKRVLGVRSDTILNTVDALRELSSIIKSDLTIDLGKYVSFYEFEIQGLFHSDKDIYLAFSNLYGDSSDFVRIKKLLGNDYSQFVLKLVPSGKNIDSTEWHEITIEPRINSAGYTFVVRMVCRDPKIDVVLDYAKSTEKTVISLIKGVLLKSVDHKR